LLAPGKNGIFNRAQTASVTSSFALARGWGRADWELGSGRRSCSCGERRVGAGARAQGPGLHGVWGRRPSGRSPRAGKGRAGPRGAGADPATREEWQKLFEQAGGPLRSLWGRWWVGGGIAGDCVENTGADAPSFAPFLLSRHSFALAPAPRPHPPSPRLPPAPAALPSLSVWLCRSLPRKPPAQNCACLLSTPSRISRSRQGDRGRYRHREHARADERRIHKAAEERIVRAQPARPSPPFPPSHTALSLSTSAREAAENGKRPISEPSTPPKMPVTPNPMPQTQNRR
jgi:hypothetical protein